MTPEEIEKIDGTLGLIAQTERDGETYLGASIEIDGRIYLVYPDPLDIPTVLRRLADEIENPSD